MRKQFFPLLFVFSVTIVSAQSRVAIVGGLNSTSVSPFLNPLSNALSKTEAKYTGPRFGFLADLALKDGSKIFFQPGAFFSAKGTSHGQLLDTSTTKIAQYTTDLKINYIDIPLNLVLKLPLKGKTKFILGAGPQTSLFYTGSSSISTIDTSGGYKADKNEDLPVGKNDQNFRVIHFSVNGLAGFEFGRVFLTAHYSKSLTPFYQQNKQDFEYTTMGASLGIFLGKMTQPKKPVVVNKDRDKDGIINIEDGCPDLPGSQATNGCPDTDGDGIADVNDQCPALAGIARNNGCPIADRDNDGTNDENDKCPDVAGLAHYDGCPVPDTDKDGVNDEEDHCPNKAGTKQNKGCPEIKKEVIEKVAYAARKIQFQLGKAVLKPESFKTLDEVIQVLKTDTELKITVEGHTSGDGNLQNNQLLSQKRAESVKQYMISKGIAAERLTAIGLGSGKPLVAETSEETRIANRRVEIKLSR